MSPLRQPELLGCHLDYKEQEELLSQKLHLAPKAEDLQKEKELKRVSLFSALFSDHSWCNACTAVAATTIKNLPKASALLYFDEKQFCHSMSWVTIQQSQ